MAHSSDDGASRSSETTTTGVDADDPADADEPANADESVDADEPTDVDEPLAAAVAAFQRGDPVLIHDAADREGETDLVYPAEAVTPSAVARLRNDAGGLICVALGHDVAAAFDLPFRQAVLDHPATADHDLGYDDRSSFSLTVNHRDTETGITDDDRSLTITALGAAAADPAGTDPAGTDFAGTFRAPGHVHLLRAAPSLDDRRGHTELAVALARAADCPPAAVVCEMLDDETGAELSPADARAYAEREGLVYLEGRAIVDAA